MYVCICNGVTDKQIKQEVKAGASTLQDLKMTLKVATCCGSCAGLACSYLPNPNARNITNSISISQDELQLALS